MCWITAEERGGQIVSIISNANVKNVAYDLYDPRYVIIFAAGVPLASDMGYVTYAK